MKINGIVKKLPLFLLLLIGRNAFAQSDKEKASELGKQAIILEDNGNFGGAFKVLQEAQKLDPESIDYPYEMAYSYYSTKEYQKAITILDNLTHHKDVFARVYQLLGNSYDNISQTDKAVETYEAGLKIFPNSGELYLESAVIQLMKKDYVKALNFCEKGIRVAPQYPSNYYWAAKLYCGSDEKIWGMLYGEMFMNLERNSKRNAEISKLLFDTYKSNITIISPTNTKVSFSKNVINVDVSNVKKFKLPFSVVYEPTLSLAVINEKNIDLISLDRIRKRFIEQYFKSGYDKLYPNVLFDYQNQLLKDGQLEAYNYWLLMKGDEQAFSQWRQANKDKWDDFIKWFTANPIKITNENKFYSGQY